MERYITFFDKIGYFDVNNILKFINKGNSLIVVTSSKTQKKIIEKLKGEVPLIISDNFKIIKKRAKSKYKIISSEIVSDRSINRDVC